MQRVATKEREKIKRTTKLKMARKHNKEGSNHLDQESNRQKTMEDIDGWLHPTAAGQSLGERQYTSFLTNNNIQDMRSALQHTNSATHNHSVTPDCP